MCVYPRVSPSAATSIIYLRLCVVTCQSSYHQFLLCFSLRAVPITDFNEITFHQLEVVHCSQLAHKSKVNMGMGMGMSSSSSMGGMNMGNSSYGNNSLNQDGGVSGGMQGSGSGEGFDNLQQRVLEVFKEDSSETGISIMFIAQQLGTDLGT